jgi:hypothetical protein
MLPLFGMFSSPVWGFLVPLSGDEWRRLVDEAAMVQGLGAPIVDGHSGVPLRGFLLDEGGGEAPAHVSIVGRLGGGDTTADATGECCCMEDPHNGSCVTHPPLGWCCDTCAANLRWYRG